MRGQELPPSLCPPARSTRHMPRMREPGENEDMNYRVELLFSINNDETEQPMPLSDEIIQAIYQGRIAPEGILVDILELQVDVF